MKSLLILCTFCLLTSCKSDTPDDKTPAAATPAPAADLGPAFESIPQPMVMDLWNKGNLIDYIFHNLPFSMNQSEQASIRTNLTYFTPMAQQYITPGCKPMGRQFFSIEGEIVLEADIYYTETCAFYVFFVDGKAKYANQMSDAGKQFFNTMIQKGLEARGQG